jgi:energy-coupling factor transport system ATP-binding protein
VITFEQVSVTYPDPAGNPGTGPGASRPSGVPVLAGVDLEVAEGELCLVVGPSGSGKSTLLRAINGLVPRFSGGLLTGVVTVNGRSTADHPPRQLADTVGYVGQDPLAGFVTDTVEDELAYVMENLGVAPQVMRRRVEDTLDLLGLHDLRRRSLATLSGGQQQRVAIGSVLTANPRVLVLDEPTSALDPAAAEDVLAALARLVHDLGITVVLAEHRLERVVQFADRVVVVPGGGGAVRVGSPAEVLPEGPVVPPVVALSELLGWDPVALSVRDARVRAGAARDLLAERLGDGKVVAAVVPGGVGPVEPAAGAVRGEAAGEPAVVIAEVHRLVAGYGTTVVLDGVDLALRAGEVTAVMGRNGAGKSTLLAQLAGLRPPLGGSVRVGAARVDPCGLPPAEAAGLVGFVPQDPALLLYSSSVAEECRSADRDAGVAPGTTAALLGDLVGEVDSSLHPRDLSEGQRLALALAVVLAGSPTLVILDEPTRGLDYAAKRALCAILSRLASGGRAVVLATHDVEVAAAVADRVVVLADGEVVADGPAREVVTHSPVFAPQVAKILSPLPMLTVAEVADALGVPA